MLDRIKPILINPLGEWLEKNKIPKSWTLRKANSLEFPEKCLSSNQVKLLPHGKPDF